jgi:predicted small secreted protein
MTWIYFFVAELPVAGRAWFKKSAGICALLLAVATILPLVLFTFLAASAVHFPLDMHWSGYGPSGQE